MAEQVSQQVSQIAGVDQLHAGFRNPDPAARPMVRWWWFGPDVDRSDLLRDLDDMAAVGLGGVECSFVYPMGASADRFLSETFLADLGFAAQAAAQRALRFDLTLGSGWPYGGPHIDETTASRRIHWEREEVRIHAQRIPVPHVWPGDEFIGAYIGEGTRGEAPTALTPLCTERDEAGQHIVIPSGRGPRVVLIAVSRLSGQTLKRAAAGAEGWALDHFSAQAARTHIAAVAEPLVSAAGPERIGTVFCDSLEVYDADWTPSLPAEFAARRGYDPLAHLWKLTRSDSTGQTFRADYHRTLTELLQENFIAVMRDWARSKGLVFRIQSYGQPPATVSSYRYADAFEGEGWGWDMITACRWASSAGQIWGRTVISSETWTWNHSPSFRSTPLDILGEAHDHLLMGINHFIGHGWPTSPRPENSDELGRVFYASAALDSRNAWWGAAPALWGTLHRLAWLMRRGVRRGDLGIYLPARDLYAGFASAGRTDLFKEAQQHIGKELPHAIRTAGLDFDLFDDDAVAGSDPPLDPGRFPVVVLPWASDVPESTRAWLAEMHSAGGTVIDLGGTAGVGLTVASAAEVPGFIAGPVGIAGVAAGMDAGESPDGAAGVEYVSGGAAGVEEGPDRPERNETVAVTTRELLPAGAGAGTATPTRIHFAANTAAWPAEVDLSWNEDVQDAGPTVIERWDAETGERIGTWWDTETVRLRLEGYEAAVLIQHGDASRIRSLDQKGNGAQAVGHAPGETTEVLELNDWTVRFPDEESPRAVAVPHRWEDEEARRLYSGEALYTTVVGIPENTRSVVLDLGPAEPHRPADPAAAGLMEASFSAAVRPPVGVVATVLVDGAEAGFLWKTPYRLDISDVITDGQTHELQLMIANVTSHRLAADRGLPRLVDEAHEHFGRRFGIQTLELALADVDSGLLKVPRLRLDGGDSARDSRHVQEARA